MRSSTPSRATSTGVSRREALGLLGLGIAGIALGAPALAISQEPDGTEIATFAAADIDTLVIDWAAGGVDVVVDDDVARDSVRIYETVRSGFLGMMPPATECTVRRQTLNIDYGKTFMSFLPRGSKSITVVLPSSMANHLLAIDINGASGDYTINNVCAESLDIDLASGNLTARDITVDELDLDMASGVITVDGRISTNVDMDFASGTVHLVCQEVCPRDIAVDAASGKLTLGLPENDGFEVRIDKLSGSVGIDFETTRKRGDDEVYIYKNGAEGSLIDIELASGSVSIERAE